MLKYIAWLHNIYFHVGCYIVPALVIYSFCNAIIVYNPQYNNFLVIYLRNLFFFSKGKTGPPQKNQTKLVREGNATYAYRWFDNKWHKIGEVTGGESKKWYKGKVGVF